MPPPPGVKVTTIGDPEASVWLSVIVTGETPVAVLGPDDPDWLMVIVSMVADGEDCPGVMSDPEPPGELPYSDGPVDVAELDGSTV